MAELRSSDIRGTQNQVQAWVNFYTTGIRNSYGISSISRTGVGTFQLNFSYTFGVCAISGNSRASTGIGGGGNWAQYFSPYDVNTTYCAIQVLDNGDQGNGFNEDPAQCTIIVHSPSSS